MISKAITLLDPVAWLTDMPLSDRPDDAQFAGVGMGAALLDAYAARKARWSVIANAVTAELPVEHHGALTPAFGAIEARFAECDQGLERIANDLAHGESERWFYAAQNPDLMVTYQMQELVKALRGISSAVVDEIITART